MNYLYSLVPIIQIISAVHVFKTGRSWYWLWIILFFPLIGSIIYIIVEVLPEFRWFTSGNAVDGILNAVQPGRELRRLQEAMELSDTVENRAALADYYVRANQPDKAIPLCERCLQGVFQNDPHITLDLCRALVSAKRYDEAKTTLEELRDRSPTHEPGKRELLYARALEGLGDTADAMRLYESVVDNSGGEEARCRWALLLEQAGQKEQARSMYQDLLKRARRFAPHYRRTQHEWINMAQEGIKRLGDE